MYASIGKCSSGERITTLGELVEFDPVPEPRLVGDIVEADVTRHCPGCTEFAPRVVVEQAGHLTAVQVAWVDDNRNGVMDPGDRILMDPVETRKVGRVHLGYGLDILSVCREVLRRLQGRGVRG